MIVAGKDQLQGWKEIASFLGRDERTAKRWEKQRGLPVRRIPGAGRANVYAIVSELDAWLAVARAPEALDVPEAQDLPDTQDRPEALDDSDTDNQSALDNDPGGTGSEQRLTASAFNPFRSEAEQFVGSTALRTEAGAYPAMAGALANPWQQPASPSARSRAGLWLLAGLTAVAVAALVLVAVRREPLRAQPVAAAHSAHAAAGPYRSPQPHADELYLQGVYLYEERTPESLASARQAFQQAIDTDSRHGPAYAGLAQTYLMLREYAGMPSELAYSQAQRAAQRAVALDPASPDAHACLGFIAFFYNWNPQEARRQFETALELEPNSALARHWFGSMLTHQGKYAEALVQLNAAQRLQPTSAAILTSRAWALGLNGQRSDADQMIHALIHNDASVAFPHRMLAMLSQINPVDYPTYLKQLTQFAELRHDTEGLEDIRTASAAYAAGGPDAMWQAVLRTQQRRHGGAAAATYLTAVAQANLRQDDTAVETLTQLVHRRSDEAMGLRIEPAFAALRGRPDYRRLMQAVGVDYGE